VLKPAVAPENIEPSAGGEEGDAALMARVAAGDAGAFRVLVERHSAMIHALAWRMLGPADAEDVVQESFTRLWVNAKSWAPSGGGLGGWLRRVATNLCLDRLRRPRMVSDDLLADHSDAAPLADDRLDEARRNAAVADAVRALPDRQCAAIVLTYYEGVPNAEAAAILGLGVKAVESLLVRARRGLTRNLVHRGLVEQGGSA
jgi:RNA polymerase sigma-70 factor (ECF subfamily)